MRIHIYFHPQGKVWAINQAADRVVFGGEAKGLQEREVSKKNLWDICAEKTRDGYMKFGEFGIADGAFHDAVWIAREMYHRDIRPVLDYLPENVYRPVLEVLALNGGRRNSINARVASLAVCWLNDHPTPTPAEPIVPMAPVMLAGGRGCYF